MSHFVLGDILGQGTMEEDLSSRRWSAGHQSPKSEGCVEGTSSDDEEVGNLQEAEMYATGEFSSYLYGDAAGGNWLLFKRWFQLSGEELPLNPCETVMDKGQVCLVADFLEKPGTHDYFFASWGEGAANAQILALQQRIDELTQRAELGRAIKKPSIVSKRFKYLEF